MSDQDQSSSDDCFVPFNSDSFHDLISPVNQVCSIAELIVRKYGGTLGGDGDVLFGFLQTAASRLEILAAGLKKYAQIVPSRGPYRRCDANALVAGAQALIQQAIDQSRAMVTHDRLPELYCDPSQISYTLASLIENSIKFRGEYRPEIHISAIPEGNNWVFSVRDNGIGIDPRHKDRIFSVFKRIHNDAYPGAGVGLAITRQIIERHGGRIWVDSEPGRGAVFLFTLPRG
jgi:light-regulated signal transduction histidine kinase (bacteriophytochrome)